MGIGCEVLSTESCVNQCDLKYWWAFFILEGSHVEPFLCVSQTLRRELHPLEIRMRMSFYVFSRPVPIERDNEEQQSDEGDRV